MGYEVIKLPPFSRLAPGVSTHADMLMLFYKDTVVTHSAYYAENKNTFDLLGVKIVLSDEQMNAVYPFDILFNSVLTNEGVLFSNSKYTSEHIKNAAKRIVDVKQGYTACSTCRIDPAAFITSDIGLYRAYTENGIDSILVEKTGISLPGYDCGFIGGATVVLPEGVCFFGNAIMYPDFKKVSCFAEKYGKKIISLSDEKLTDIGGAVVL